MGFFKNLFGSQNKKTSQPSEDTVSTTDISETEISSQKNSNLDNGPVCIEDLRSSSQGDGEAIVNLWYETDRTIISELRAKAYIFSGDDNAKFKFLQSRANTDWKDAQKYPVPDAVKTTLTLAEGSSTTDMGKACVHSTLEMMGGNMALFADVFSKVPSGDYIYDRSQVLMCVTGLMRDANDQLAVQIDNVTHL